MEETKEYGLNREVMNSISLYIYYSESSELPDTMEGIVSIFNDWLFVCGSKVHDARFIAAALDYIRKVMKLPREDIEKALAMDHLLPIHFDHQ